MPAGTHRILVTDPEHSDTSLLMSPLPARPSTDGADRRTAPVPFVGDDAALVARIRAGDKVAFEQLFRSYYHRLVVVMRGYVHSSAIAEERVQDILFHIWEHRADWTVRDGLARYLYGAVRNQGVNWRKRDRVVARWAGRAVADPGVSGMGQGPRSPEDVVGHDEIDGALARAVARLPERRRMAFTLRSQYHLTNREIADAMGVTVKAVEKAMAAALKALRKELSELL